MAVLVVHRLEVVEVHHEQREQVLVALRPHHLVLESFIELPVVVEARQAVTCRNPRQFALQEPLD